MKIKVTDKEFEKMKDMENEIGGIKEKIKHMKLESLKNEIEIISEQKQALVEKINELNKKNNIQENLIDDLRKKVDKSEKSEIFLDDEETGEKITPIQKVQKLEAKLIGIEEELKVNLEERTKIYEQEREAADVVDKINKKFLGYALNFEANLENKVAKGMLKTCLEEHKNFGNEISIVGKLKQTDFLGSEF